MLEVSPDGYGAHPTRLTTYAAVATDLALLSDHRLGDLVDEAPIIGSGIGGSTVLLDIEGTPVFAKRVPLTDLERRPENVRSTANVFGLPTFFQYGVGSVGFGAWRELAANTKTTNWVLGKHCDSFPLMYHWRVLPGSAPMSEAYADLDATVAYWAGSSAVRARLEALSRAKASVVLFLEYVPQNLHDWLTAQLASGDDAVESACAMVERNLRTAVSFMNGNGLLHFDAHFRNVLTDGRRLYFADLGLATARRFALSAAEVDFLEQNLSHDRCYTVTHLVHCLVAALTEAVDWPARVEVIRRCAQGDDGPLSTVPGSAAAVVKRYAPIAVVMNEFYSNLHGHSRTTLYPVDEIRRVCASTGFVGGFSERG